MTDENGEPELSRLFDAVSMRGRQSDVEIKAW